MSNGAAVRPSLLSLLRILQIRRAFKTLVTKEHPDKGGSPDRFKLIKLSYDTLSNKSKVSCRRLMLPRQY